VIVLQLLLIYRHRTPENYGPDLAKFFSEVFYLVVFVHIVNLINNKVRSR